MGLTRRGISFLKAFQFTVFSFQALRNFTTKLKASRAFFSRVILNEVKDLLRLNVEILRGVYTDHIRHSQCRLRECAQNGILLITRYGLTQNKDRTTNKSWRVFLGLLD